MTLSRRKIYLALALSVVVVTAFAATPPDAEMAAAQAALAAAERRQPQGEAAANLTDARDRYAQAQAAYGRRKYKDALIWAEDAAAAADLAAAQADLANARQDVDEKAARNADLRRQLQLPSGASP